MSGAPSLPDLLQVAGSVGAVIGAIIGLAFPADSERAVVENAALGITLGAAVGTVFALSSWAFSRVASL
jgi:hypothetical protein